MVEPELPTVRVSSHSDVLFQTPSFTTPCLLSLHPLTSLSINRVVYVTLCLVHYDPWIISSLSPWSVGVLNLTLAQFAASLCVGHCDAHAKYCTVSGLWQAALLPATNHKIKKRRDSLDSFHSPVFKSVKENACLNHSFASIFVNNT